MMREPSTRRVLRVFLASPNDVAEERAAAERVVSDVNKILGRRLGLHVDLHKWEEKSPEFGRPQSIINPDVDRCNVFVGLLWERWGHPSGRYSSGFEEEFERARARHKKTGEPKIWLVFKEPRPEKSTDLGPQLSGVLAFREGLIKANEALFTDVRDANQWERKLHNWLTEHLLDSSGVEEPVRAPDSTVSSPPPQTDSGALLTPHSRKTTEQSEILAQISELSELLSKVVSTRQLEFRPGEERLFGEFDAARLHLLSTTWMSKRYTGDFLGTHEANILYKHREQLRAAALEYSLLFRTLLSDVSDVVPGWFWFDELKSEGLTFLLLELANNDPSATLRARAVRIMESADIEPPDDRWDMLPVRDEDHVVRWAAYDYLGAIGTESAVPLLEEVASTCENEITRVNLSEARFQILARVDTQRAFSEMIADPDRVSDKAVKTVRSAAGKIDTPTLKQGLTSPDVRMRKLATVELISRGALPLDQAENLTRDDSASIRALAFKELIKKGKEIDLAKIEDSFASREEEHGGFLGRAGRLSDMLGGYAGSNLRELSASVILSFFQPLPIEKLLERVDWLLPHGAMAYKCLACDHYQSICEYIRSDMANGFQRVRDASLERLRAEYGSEGLERLMGSIEKLDSYTRDEFLEAALTGLAKHAESSDLDIARKYLSHQRPGVKLAALDILCRLGSSDDVAALIAISKESNGKSRAKAAAAALRIAPEPFDVAQAFINGKVEELAEIGFRWLLEDNSAGTKRLFQDLLNSENEKNRERAIYYLSRRLNEVEQRALLEECLRRESYYYNVVAWLDRLLYAPLVLKEMYLRELQENIFRVQET
jgi:HEAT repeat protein